MQQKLDKLIIGLMLGIIIPALATFLFHRFFVHGIAINEYIKTIIKHHLVSHMISICTVPNLLLFFLFLWLNMLRAARGVLFATMLFAVATFIIKFI